MTEVYLVGMRDYAPDAAFSSLAAAREWAIEHGYRNDPDDAIVGPYVLDHPEIELPAWFELPT